MTTSIWLYLTPHSNTADFSTSTQLHTESSTITPPKPLYSCPRYSPQNTWKINIFLLDQRVQEVEVVGIRNALNILTESRIN